MEPMPEVCCPHCHKIQAFRGQRECIHDGCRWSNWFIARLYEAISARRQLPAPPRSAIAIR